MSIFFKLFAGLVSTTAVIGSVAGVALRNKPEEKTKSVEEDAQSSIQQPISTTQILNESVPTVSNPANKTTIISKADFQNHLNYSVSRTKPALNFTTKKYACFFKKAVISEFSRINNQPPLQKELVDCEITPIIFSQGQTSKNIKEIKDLPLWNGTNPKVSEIFSQDVWLKLEFDITKNQDYEFDFVIPITVYFEENQEVVLYNHLLIKDNKIKSQSYDLLVAKTEDNKPNVDFQHKSNKWYYCSTIDNLTSIRHDNTTDNNAFKCELIFLNDEINVENNTTPESFDFNNLHRSFDKSYLTKQIKQNQYFVISNSLAENKTYDTLPIHYYELGTDNNSLTKITTFQPVMPIFGELKSSQLSSTTKLFFSEQLTI